MLVLMALSTDLASTLSDYSDDCLALHFAPFFTVNRVRGDCAVVSTGSAGLALST